MDPAYAAAYSDLAAHHWWWRARESLLVDEIQKLRRGRPPGRILDVGCGDGRLFPSLERFGEVQGIEPDPATLGTTVPAGRRIHHAPFEAPLPVTGKFDLILMLDVLEHLDDPVASLALARALLAPDGVLLLTVPALPALWTRHDELNHHRVRYTRAELRRQLVRAGLLPRMLRFEFHTLALVKLFVRVAEVIRSGKPRLPRLPHPAVNRVVGSFFRMEARVARPVAKWLPGSSLLALASLPAHGNNFPPI